MNKKNTFFLTCFLLLFTCLHAQKDIKLEIRHWLGNVPFALEFNLQNNIGYDFNVSRLEYYISEIEITHDSGQVTSINDFWLLINPSQPTLVELGSLAVDQIEAISFYVGVDPAHNHLDPSLYAASHPLAPKSPTMHWGWASGYRFIAIEGQSGLNFRSEYQLHGLGDGNYFKTEIANPLLTSMGDSIIISLDANYAAILQGMDLSQPMIIHGERNEAQRALLNMRDFVFSPANPTTAIEDDGFGFSLKVFPNPSNGEQIHLKLPERTHPGYRVIVSDVLGRHLLDQKISSREREMSFSLKRAGVYLVSVIHNEEVLVSKKIVVTF